MLLYSSAHTLCRITGAHSIRIGFTDQIIERIGDITRIEWATSSEDETSSDAGPKLRRFTPADDSPISSFGSGKHYWGCKLHWEGYGITTADELYHTVWENIEGELELLIPPCLYSSDGTAIADTKYVNHESLSSHLKLGIDDTDWFIEIQRRDVADVLLGAAEEASSVNSSSGHDMLFFKHEDDYQQHVFELSGDSGQDSDGEILYYA